MPDRVNPAVKRLQPPEVNAVLDRSGAEAEIQELRP